MFKKIALAAAVLLGILAAGTACASEINPEPIKIVTTIFPAYDFARAAAGGRADILMLVRPGSEVHTFDPSPRDIIAIRNADVFIYIGGESEAWAETLLSSPDMSGKTVLRLIDFVNAIEEISGHEESRNEENHEERHDGHHHENSFDEHIWTSPKNAAVLVGAVSDALCAANPPNAEEYKRSAARYMGEIGELSGEFASLVRSAERKKIILGDRFPFRYFAEETGLEFISAFPGCDVGSDVSAATLAHMMNVTESEKIPVVYRLELGSGGVARAIAGQTGAEVLTLHSCQNVTKAEFEGGATYLSLMRQNLESLKKGLGIAE